MSAGHTYGRGTTERAIRVAFALTGSFLLSLLVLPQWYCTAFSARAVSRACP
mgnify:FL=1